MFILYITSRYSHFNILFSKPCQRQYELLPSLGVYRLSSVIVYFSHFNLQTRVIFLLTEEKILKKSTNQKQELPVVAMFANELGRKDQTL
jgi:hypothetical protein